uniref:Uncharacterized protein n=1 Tax=Octactis speculum TaxID=3111310 RepID=A0A6U3T5W4_9STRA|mmetsp:Transcript_35014/g.47296  ORF Transcript_35014/g.47296 Transcript_35014/m.47296 type:complete len:298 (+) Transcript_35014:37-930(+)|eukprot:CAMPEP_0185761370 /NCGR_PEP_ID=MMETSP1174-20130828/20294_1 /TAXON_ID=35687 /ORGANISM="Dictyocha speculum, Strain CCMP1381" /LENGTH=297 /DNA_ID=CAMNT_0028442583 /DNA_START=35 /DNA_END=928 /DNA_ORIENTATION=+
MTSLRKKKNEYLIIGKCRKVFLDAAGEDASNPPNVSTVANTMEPSPTTSDPPAVTEPTISAGDVGNTDSVTEAAPRDATAAPSAAAETSTSANSASEAIEIAVTDLPAFVDAAVAEGLTPLICDPGNNKVVDTFFSYGGMGAVVLDAKKMGMDKTMRKTPVPNILEVARTKVVRAMRSGSTLVISMQQAAVDMIGTFNGETTLPIELFNNSGAGFVNAPSMSGDGDIVLNERTDMIFRPEDTVETAGIVMCRQGFQVVVTSHFQSEDLDSYLFSGEYGLPTRDKFKVIKIRSDDSED